MERKKKKFDLIKQISKEFIEYKQPILTMKKSFSGDNLSYDDWSLINNINKSYDIWALECDTNHIKSYLLNKTKLQDFLNDEQQMYRSLIQFYKEIPQFKQIDFKDQILLIKCNLTHLIHIHHILKDNFIENDQIGFHMSQWINQDFHKEMSKTRHSFDYFIENPIILLPGPRGHQLPFHQLSYQIIDQKLLIQNQNLFVTLLWKYLNIIYNEKDAIKAIQTIIFQFLRYQLLMDQMEHFIIKQNHFDQFHPLIKSVLRLT